MQCERCKSGHTVIKGECIACGHVRGETVIPVRTPEADKASRRKGRNGRRDSYLQRGIRLSRAYLIDFQALD